MVATYSSHPQAVSPAGRSKAPELEADYNRNPSLGYEPTGEVGFIRCLDHGYPTPLARWHCHDEYELHLITATSGKAFVGDWIGPFEPGHLVMCGPRLPHNWVSLDAPPGGVAERDLVIQFHPAPLVQAAAVTPLHSRATCSRYPGPGTSAGHARNECRGCSL